MAEKVKRRLTTVLCADVQSYTSLMEADEAGTLETLRRCREAMDGIIARHEGRIVNTWGDAIIAEFPSVVEAVQCAVEIQTELSSPNQGRPVAQQMWFRIGINLGDIMVEDGNIYGEGVNIAARLQEKAEPGGILISGPVYEHVRKKLSISFDFFGDQAVKNVSEPVTSYRVLLDGDGDQPTAWFGLGKRDRRHAPGPEPETGSRRGVRAAGSGFFDLPRPVAIAFALVGFLFTINLFAGIGSVWFHWPSAPILLFAVLYMILRGKRAGRKA